MSVEDMARQAGSDIGLTLKPEQVQVCASYAAGKDTYFLAPTGFGKSAVYQVAPLLFEKLQRTHTQVLVVMPLLSLIHDSIRRLKEILPSHPAVHLTCANVTCASTATFIFASAETMTGVVGQALMNDRRLAISVMFIDECHVITTWGQSVDGAPFRSAYGTLSALRACLPLVPVVCMSATLTKEMQQEVTLSIQMKDPTIVEVHMNKSNIVYHRLACPELDFTWLATLLMKADAPKMLMFFSSTDTLSTAFAMIAHTIGQQPGDPVPLVRMYHSSTNSEIKGETVDDLNTDSGNTRLVLCTSALSMGVNLKDIDYVFHYGLPTTSTAFLQESGRAGREGRQCHSVAILYPGMAAGRQLSQSMKEYRSSDNCLRQILLGDFQVKCAAQSDCCTNCGTGLPSILRDVNSRDFDAIDFSDESE